MFIAFDLEDKKVLGNFTTYTAAWQKVLNEFGDNHNCMVIEDRLDGTQTVYKNFEQ